jgi:hypothetical protein
MSETTAADAATQVSVPSEYYPFPSTVHNPDQRYCSDKALWDVYKASLLLEKQIERKRCREIALSYANLGRPLFENDIFEIIRKIDLR